MCSSPTFRSPAAWSPRDDARPAWAETEIVLTALTTRANPYPDVEVWADFRHDDGTLLRRPAFYDGNGT